MNKKNRWLTIATGIAFLAFYSVIVLVLSERSSGLVLYESVQPPEIDYGRDEEGRYALRIYAGSIKWNSPDWSRRSEIAVARYPFEHGDYGHGIELDITGSPDVSETLWSTDGIELIFKTGHRLFIPMSAFLGGR